MSCSAEHQSTLLCHRLYKLLAADCLAAHFFWRFFWLKGSRRRSPRTSVVFRTLLPCWSLRRHFRSATLLLYRSLSISDDFGVIRNRPQYLGLYFQSLWRESAGNAFRVAHKCKTDQRKQSTTKLKYAQVMFGDSDCLHVGRGWIDLSIFRLRN